MAETGLNSFWRELRRRKVVRVAIVYVVVAWLLIQIAEVTFDPLRLPEWAVTLVIALTVFGFPLAIVLAWAFELSPDGIKRDRPRADTDAAANSASASEGEHTPLPSRAVMVDPEVPAGPVDDRRAIAVLPLTNMSGDPENEFFSDGIAEEILNLLARQPNLRVVSRTSSFSFKNTTLDVPTIANKLGVDIVLEGSVRRAGKRVRIVAQLIDAANDAHLWSDSYDRELEDIFAVQTDIAKRIVDAMDLDPDTCVDCGGNTQDIDAYDYYLRGRQYYHQLTTRDLEFACEMFRKAIDKDPEFARAYAGLADTEGVIAQWIDRSAEHVEAADSASLKALELAPDLAEAHASRGSALSVKGDYEAAAEHFERALALDPMHYESLYHYGRSRFGEGKLEHAADLWRRAHEAWPDEFQAASLRVGALSGLGRKDEALEANAIALEAIDRRLALNPDDQRALMLGGCVAHTAGREADGRAMIERVLKLAPNDGGVLHNVTCYYSNIGDVEKAIEMLERRMAVMGTIYRDWIDNDSDFDNIRDDPRFKALVEKIPERPA
ncbi:MAG: tetratricopeptide repeat protein [Gammaproteobacteria bacterium]|nr:MAG: tetratricopeptide repeat protein [Gammaproteobacteria bacterium]